MTKRNKPAKKKQSHNHSVNPDAQPNHKFPLVIAIVIAFFATGLYLNTLKNGFVWDDAATIENNAFITSLKNTPKLFTMDYFSSRTQVLEERNNIVGSGEVTYRPLVTFSYMLDYQIWKKNPAGYHLTNAVIHGLCALLLMLLSWVLFHDKTWCYITGAIFAAHPVASEAINAISFREDNLALLFLLPALIFFTTSWRNQPHKFQSSILPALFTFFTCLSKEMGAVTPLLMGTICLLSPRKNLFAFKNFKMLILPSAAAALYLLIYFVIMKNPAEETIGWYAGRLDVHIAAMIRTFGIYILLFFGMARNCINHDIVPPPSLYDLQAVLSLTGLFILAVTGVIFYRKKWKGGLGLLWVVISLLPVAGIIPTAHLAAERYLYIPLAGFSVFSGWCILQGAKYIARKYKISLYKPVAILLLLVVIPSSIRVVNHNPTWKNQESLWAAAIEVNPDSHMGQYGLANCYLRSKDYRSAIPHYERAMTIDPNNSKSYNNCGLCYTHLKEYPKAIDTFEKALHIRPENHRLYSNLAHALILSKNYPKARIYAEKALQIKPDYPGALYHVATADLFQGRYAEAMIHVKQSLKLNPNYKPSQGLYDYLIKNPPKK